MPTQNTFLGLDKHFTHFMKVTQFLFLKQKIPALSKDNPRHHEVGVFCTLDEQAALRVSHPVLL